MKQLLTILFPLLATSVLWAGNTITYTATQKLNPVSPSSTGYICPLQEHATTFGPEILSHEFANGTGTITCNGEITMIGDGAFFECSGLTSVAISSSVEMIGEDAFYNCTGLTSVAIPNSVKTIGTRTFMSCSSLMDVYVSWIEDIPTPEESAFDVSRQQACTLHCPQGTMGLYVDAGWNRWFDLIGQAFKEGKAAGIAEGDAAGYARGLEEGKAALPTDAEDVAGHTVTITKGEKTLKLVNPDKVTYGKQE